MKISNLPLNAAPDGTETVPHVKGGVSMQASLSALAQPMVSAAQAAANAAEGLVGMSYATTAAGLAATASGHAFAVANANGTVGVYLNNAGVAVLQRIVATTTALASTAVGAGASLVNTVLGQNVQAALDHVMGGNVITPMARAIAATIAIGAGQQASGGGATMTGAPGELASLTGAGARLRDMSLIGPVGAAGVQQLGVFTSYVSQSVLDRVSVDLTASSAGTGLVAFALTGDISNHFSFGLTANTPGYAYLLNNADANAHTQDGHILMGFNLTSGGADVVTIVRRESGGFVFWGNTTCAEEGSDYAFESAVWSLYALQDIIVTYFGPSFDQPMNLGTVKNLLEKVNKSVTAEVTAGRLIGGKIALASTGNTSAELAAGRPKFQIKFTPCAPLNNPSVDFAITDEFYDGFADAVATSD